MISYNTLLHNVTRGGDTMKCVWIVEAEENDGTCSWVDTVYGNEEDAAAEAMRLSRLYPSAESGTHYFVEKYPIKGRYYD